MPLRTTVLCASLMACLASVSAIADAKAGVLPSPEVVFAPPEGANISAGVASDGADGVWFSDIEPSGAYLEHYAPGAAPSGISVPTGGASGENGQVFAIAPGAGGSEAFAQTFGSRLYDISATDTLSSTELPEDTSPYDFVFDSQGNLWLTNHWAACSVERVTPLGEITTTYIAGNTCEQLTVGPDGNIWIAVNYPTMAVVKLSAQTGTVMATYPLPSAATGIASTAGRVWVTEAESSRIASITPSGKITQHKLPADRDPNWLTVGPDGALWFIEGNGPGKASPQHGGIGRMTAGGKVSEVALPGEVHATEMTATRDALYFTAGGSLMRIQTASAPIEGGYVALGDSYSSGEGNPPYEEGTNTEGETPNTCHRSATAYGPLLSRALDLEPMTFKACSGAVTNDIFEANVTDIGEPAQISWLNSSTKIVTLTIGGNDAGFAWVIEHCTSLPPRELNLACQKNKQLMRETQARLTALGGGAYATTPSPLYQPIHSILSVIHAIHSHAHSAHIYIGLYPQLFGVSQVYYSDIVPGVGKTIACEVGPNVWMSYKGALWLNKLGEQLDKVISNAVTHAQHEQIAVNAVTASGFASHGFCDESERWFHQVGIEVTHLAELELAIGATSGSFHPTTIGQRLGYETAFEAAIG
jgi:streptogramin lyase